MREAGHSCFAEGSLAFAPSIRTFIIGGRAVSATVGAAPAFFISAVPTAITLLL